jgi:competence protein ComEA
MPSLLRHRDRSAARLVAQQRLALLADEIAVAHSGRAGEEGRSVGPGSGADSGSAGSGPPGVESAVRGRHRADPLGTGARVGAAVGDRLPVGVRWRTERAVSAQHVAVVALVVAALVAAGSWWALAGRPGEPTAVAPVVTPMASPAAPPGASGEELSGQSWAESTGESQAADAPPGAAGTDPSAPQAQGDVVVDVTGRVRSPGLVTLPAGSRVADALEAAGGLRPGSRGTGLNLARTLVDGEQILVGVRPAPWPPQPAESGGPAAPSASVPDPAAAPIDLNTATLEQLDVLPGIGPVTAQAILDWRSAHGAFTSVDELLEVDGIGDVTLADIRDLVTV